MNKLLSAVFAMLFLLVGCGETETGAPVADEAENKVEEVVVEPVLTFLDDFTEYGYSVEQIDSFREILVNVGITEIADLNIGDVSSGMQVVKGTAYKDASHKGKEATIRFNIENGVLFYIHAYFPSGGFSGLDDNRAELYYDTAGGYLKRIDWEEKAVLEFTPEEITALLNTDSLEAGASASSPLIITAEELAEDVSRDLEAAKEKYNNKWVKITGEITDTSDAGSMYGYYLYGKRGSDEMRIICWCDDGPFKAFVVGNTQTFLGFLSEVRINDPIDIGGCERVTE